MEAVIEMILSSYSLVLFYSFPRMLFLEADFS